MRRKITITIISIILITAGILGYLYFPKIFGSVIYPLEYKDFIIKSANDNNLDPSLVAGIIYTESHFNPKATSRVGAKGLMQLMPATAKSISSQLEEKEMGDLFDPQTNIRYGSYYIAQKISEFNGNVDAALAAYNGGSSVGNRYLTSREASIPRETQGFIKKVNAAKDEYAKLYGQNLDVSIDAKTQMQIKKGKNLLTNFFSLFKLNQ